MAAPAARFMEAAGSPHKSPAEIASDCVPSWAGLARFRKVEGPENQLPTCIGQAKWQAPLVACLRPVLEVPLATLELTPRECNQSRQATELLFVSKQSRLQ